MFDQIINHQDFRSEEIQLQPGYITEDRSFVSSKSLYLRHKKYFKKRN